MNKPVCPCCGSDTQKENVSDIVFKHPIFGMNVCVKEVPFYLCLSCKEDWQSPEQFNKYQKLVEKALGKLEIKELFKSTCIDCGLYPAKGNCPEEDPELARCYGKACVYTREDKSE